MRLQQKSKRKHHCLSNRNRTSDRWIYWYRYSPPLCQLSYRERALGFAAYQSLFSYQYLHLLYDMTQLYSKFQVQVNKRQKRGSFD